MAANIQLAAVIAAPTGTGSNYIQSYPTKTSVGNVFLQSGASTLIKRVELKRTDPKPTKDFPGVRRGSVKLVIPVAVGDVVREMIFEINSNVPADIPQATVDTAAVELQCLAVHASALSSLKTQSVEV